MSEAPDIKPGLPRSLRRLVNATLELVENRIELLVIELQEERLRVLHAAVFLFGVMVCAAMLLVLLTLGILYLFREHGFWYAFAGLLVFYGGAGLFCWRRLAGLYRGNPSFAATLDQFRKDRQWLRKRN